MTGTVDAKLVDRLARLSPDDRTAVLSQLTPEERFVLSESITGWSDGRWAQYRADPVQFVTEGLQETVWSGQRQILESIRDNIRTAVPACHAPGKSHMAARAVAWWGACHPPGTALVVTTATTFRQVRNILWPHVRRVVKRHNLPGHDHVNQTEWHIADDLVAYGFSSGDNDEAAVQGIHAPNLLVVVDEAGGISHTLGNALTALMTGSNTRLLLLGNPPTDEEDSWFERCCTSPLFNVIRIGAHDTPNFTGEDPGMCRACPPQVAEHSVGEHLVDPGWVNDVATQFGEDHPFYIARVQAQFPADLTTKTIPFSWVEKAAENENPWEGQYIKYGVDVASGGGDEVVIARVDGYVGRVLHARAGKDNQNAVDVAGRVLEHIVKGGRQAKKAGMPPPLVKVDATGVGWGVASLLQRWGEEGKHLCQIVPVYVGAKANDPQRFANQRAEMWWLGRELTEPDPHTGRQQARFEIDRKEMAQFSAPTYMMDSAGRIAIEKKDKMKGRGVQSPDRAEGILLAYYDPPGIGHGYLPAPTSFGQQNEWRM